MKVLTRLSALEISRGHFFSTGYPLIDIVGISEADNCMNFLFWWNSDRLLDRRIFLHCCYGVSDETGAESHAVRRKQDILCCQHGVLSRTACSWLGSDYNGSRAIVKEPVFTKKN